MSQSEMPRYLIRDWNVTIDGLSQIGQASEFALPELKVKTEEIRNAGMIMPIEVQMGYDKVTGKLKVTGFDPSTLALFGVKIGKVTEFLGTCAPVDEDGTVHSGVFYARGFLTSLKPAAWVSEGKKHDVEYEMSYRYCKLEIDQQPIFEMDPFDIKIRGVSQYGDIRRALLLT